MSNKKNPVAGNQNQRPMRDAGTGQVLDNTDSKGGHLGDVEHIAGSDTILHVGPLSETVEANSNVQKDPRNQVTVDAQAGESPVNQPADAQATAGEGDAKPTQAQESSGDQPTDARRGESDQAGQSPTEESAQKPDGASQGADAKTAPDSTQGAKGDAAGVPAAKSGDAVRSSDQTKAQDQEGGEKASLTSPEAAAPAAEQTVALTTKEAVKLSDSDLRALYKHKLPDDTLASWDYGTLLTYHENRLMPIKTQRGNWPVDVRRDRGMKNWNSTELLDWLSGDINKPKSVLEEDLWDEIYKRFRIPGNWSHEQAKAFIQDDVKPEYTESGVLVEDSSREQKSISNWTYKELRSALLGDVKSKFTQEELLEQLRKRLNLSDNYSGSRLLESLPETPTEANVNDTLLSSKLDEYKNVMLKNGTNLTPETAGQAQVMLYKAIRSVMAREPQSFHEGWNIILDFVNANYSQLFTDEKARRGWAQLGTLSKAAISTFEDILTLIIQTRAPGNRAQAAKLYSLNQILRHVTSEDERNNIVHYYAAP